MTIPAAFLDELRARTALSARIQRTTPLKKAGREWKACCPFHQEKTPSFTVNDEKGFYHCFGCGAHGDIIRWMTDQEGMQFLDAVRELADAAGLDLPAPDPQAAERARRREATVDINARAQRFFAASLAPERGSTEAQRARDYLAARGIDESLRERFGIGFAPYTRAGQPSPIQACISDVDSAELERMGLVKRSPDGERVYDFFRGRIMIPIHDARGGVIGFGGRLVGDGEPKYLNSPDTPVFDKGRTLFNIHRASAPARAKGKLLIVEGYMDVIGLDRVGFDAAVAPNGTALTEHQLFLAWKLVDVPTVCFDGDTAGRRAAVRAALRALPLMEPGKSLRFAFPPDGQDPDDLARSGGLESINAMVDAAQPLIDVVWRDLTERYNVRDPDRRAALAAEIKTLIGSIRSPEVRSSYHAAFRDLFQSAGQRTRAAGHHVSRGRGRNIAHAVEAALVVGIVDHPRILETFGGAIANLRWREEDHRRLATALADAAEDGQLDPPVVIEAAGLTELVGRLRTDALAMPFMREPDPARAQDLLVQALRANFN
jgi:DNA primase